jgi:hypothetical protein
MTDPQSGALTMDTRAVEPGMRSWSVAPMADTPSTQPNCPVPESKAGRPTGIGTPGHLGRRVSGAVGLEASLELGTPVWQLT